MAECCQRHDLTLVALETDQDQVQVFVSAPPRFSPAAIATLLQGCSSRYLSARFPHLKRVCGTDHLWTQAYSVGTAGNVSAEIIRRSILDCQGKEQATRWALSSPSLDVLLQFNRDTDQRSATGRGTPEPTGRARFGRSLVTAPRQWSRDADARPRRSACARPSRRGSRQGADVGKATNVSLLPRSPVTRSGCQWTGHFS